MIFIENDGGNFSAKGERGNYYIHAMVWAYLEYRENDDDFKFKKESLGTFNSVDEAKAYAEEVEAGECND